MGRKNKNVIQSFKCSQRYYARRHGKFKRFRRFTIRVEREEAWLDFLIARAEKKRKKASKKSARRNGKLRADQSHSEPA